jgi:hypothetical protein
VPAEDDVVPGDGGEPNPDSDDPDECLPLTPEQDAALTELWQSMLATASPEVQQLGPRATWCGPTRTPTVVVKD